MRKRYEIIKDTKAVYAIGSHATDKDIQAVVDNQLLTLEVLLDIRDKLYEPKH